MARYSLIGTASLFLALSFSSCNKADITSLGETSNESQSQPFSLFASLGDTKTANNNSFSTAWVLTDGLNVFHKVSTGSDYKNDGQFTIDDAASGHASGTLGGEITSGNEYNWYAFYPYNEYITTPKNTDGGRTYIGCRSDGVQTQNGNSSVAHIAGTNYPLWGQATEQYDGSTSPVITMHQVCALIEVTVTNSLSEAVTITGVDFIAPEGTDIVGYYYIDFSGTEPSFTKYVNPQSETNYQSETASLDVTDGTAIAKNGIAKFYLAVKPFTASTGETITVKVTGSTSLGSGTQTKNITLSKETSFQAGKIKKVAVEFNPTIEKKLSWNLAAASYTETPSEGSITWENALLTMTNNRNGDKNTAVNNYIPTEKTSTRMYTGNKLTFTPSDTYKSTYAIKKVVFNATSDGYASAFASSTWTKANVIANSKVVTIYPHDGTVGFSAVLTGTVGFDNVDIYYDELRTPSGLTIADYTTNFNKGDSFSFGGTATASFSTGNNEDVTNYIVCSGYDMSTSGEQTVTVKYSQGGTSQTKTYTINVAAPSGTQVTYTVESTSKVTTSGTAPSGSSATYSSTYDKKCQLTSGNSMTLTLSGFSGKTITGIKLSMKSNAKAGAGTFSAVAGTTSLASISTGTNFNGWFDNTSYGTDYRDVHVNMTNTEYTIQSSDTIVITITATVNSLYCQSFEITYK